MILAFLVFCVAFVLALAFVPLLKRHVAGPLGLLDHPDDNRKLHTSAIPLIGGIAVYLSVAISVLLVFFVGSRQFGLDEIVLKPGDQSQFLGLLIGGAFLLLVGIVDDSIGLRGRQKLLGQVISVVILIAFGFNINKLSIMGTEIEFGTFSFLIVIVWCLAVINSINLLDGADGFASTIGIVMSLAMAVMAWNHPNGRVVDAFVVLALAGALLGFLKFNFPPAKAFLGDAGSMLIGFILAAVSIRCTLKQHTSYAFFAPIAMLAIPFIDTAAAIIRRKLTGRSIYSVDRGHLHHSMMKRGFGPRVSLIWVAALCATTAAGGTISFLLGQSEFALVSIVIVVVVMILGGIFGTAEVELVSNKARNLGKSIVRGKQKQQEAYRQSSVQLQGHCDWKPVWLELCEFADEHELNEITFDINLPWKHESFHANRRRADVRKSEADEWYVELPLIVEGKIFGRVELHVSRSCRFTHHDIVANLMKLTANLEPVLQDIASEVDGASTSEIEEPVAEEGAFETETPSATSSG